MNDLMKTVARAICVAGGDDPDREGKGVRLTGYDPQAKAVLKLLAEPTPEMIQIVARAIMEANGGCMVKDWEHEIKENPNVAQAYKDATSALIAISGMKSDEQEIDLIIQNLTPAQYEAVENQKCSKSVARALKAKGLINGVLGTGAIVEIVETPKGDRVRKAILEIEKSKTDDILRPYLEAGHDLDSLFKDGGEYKCAKCGSHQINLSEDLVYGEMRKCVSKN